MRLISTSALATSQSQRDREIEKDGRLDSFFEYQCKRNETRAGVLFYFIKLALKTFTKLSNVLQYGTKQIHQLASKKLRLKHHFEKFRNTGNVLSVMSDPESGMTHRK